MKLIPEYPNYSITKEGNIINNKKNRELKLILGNMGYYQVSLSNKGKIKNFNIHRLLAVAFLDNIENKKSINHINGIKTDNRIENLEWVTAGENNQHAYNIGLKHSNKDNICLYDADIILKKNIVDKCYNLLQDNKIDIIYPYNGYFYDVPKHLHNNLNIETLSINDCKLLSDRSVGGVVFFKKNIFIEGGCGNQNFIGAGYEDNELYERYKKLGYSIGRLNAPLFHLTHQRKETSFDYNPYDSHNKKEFFRICNMTKEELLKEIKTWNYAI
jgi:predicted glycosyltransferase involved in capsule biosynthesis